MRLGPLICERALPSYGHTGLCLLLRRNASFSASLTCLFVAMVSLKYIFLLLALVIFSSFFHFFSFLHLSGLVPVALRARFKCVWVFCVEKPFGFQPLPAIQVRPNCVISGFWSHRRNQRERPKRRGKMHETKADENGPDWIMSEFGTGRRYAGRLGSSVLSHSALQLNESYKIKEF